MTMTWQRRGCTRAAARSAAARVGAGAGRAGPAWGVVDGGERRQEQRAARAAPGRCRRRSAARDEDAEPVAAAHGQHPECGGRAERDVALLARCRPEVEARRSVDDDPRLELAVGLGRADLHLRGAGREVPVDRAARRRPARTVGPRPARCPARRS